MADTETVTTTESWGSRLGTSLKGMIAGLALFIGGFPLLFWNEGNAVKTRKALEEGEGACVSIDSNAAVDPANEGVLVHMTGLADTQDVLSDDVFGVSERAIKLSRKVEMYQWLEESRTTEKKKMGGSVERTTTYFYKRGWSDRLSQSEEFHQPVGHENPAAMPFEEAELSASGVTFGAFRLTPDMINRIGDEKAYVFPTNYVCPIANAKAVGSFVYVPADTASAAAAAASPSAAPMTADDALSVSNLVTNVVAAVSGPTSRSVLKNPQIGDVRTSFTVIRPHDISLVYKQSGDTFVPYTAKNGKRVALLKDGVHDAAEMFAAAQSANSMMCWLVRLAGFLLMFFGVSMVLKPLSVLADVLPILGDIVEVVNAIGAGVVAAACSLVTIAVAWLFYRPVLGVLLIAAAVGLVYLKKKAKTAVAAAEQKAKAKEG